MSEMWRSLHRAARFGSNVLQQNMTLALPRRPWSPYRSYASKANKGHADGSDKSSSSQSGTKITAAIQQASARSKTPHRKKLLKSLNAPGIVIPDDHLCAAYCLPAPLDLDRLQQKEQAFAGMLGLQSWTPDVVHLRATQEESKKDDNSGSGVAAQVSNSQDTRKGHVFAFASGAVVFWTVPLERRQSIMSKLERLTVERTMDSALAMSEFDHEFEIQMVGTSSSSQNQRNEFRRDVFYISDYENVGELLAFSYGLAHSVKLLVYEEAIDLLAERTRNLPVQMSLSGRIGMSSSDIKKLIGQLLAARYAVNLDSDILDTPEFFWDHPELGNMFFQTVGELELSKRASLLDKRMENIKDMFDLLNNEVASSGSHRVERAILFLIAVEVAITILNTLHG